MASERMNRILCAADPSGSVEAIERLLVVADEQDVDAVTMLGDIGEHGDGYRGVLGALARARCPVFWVPGPGDVPVERYLREAFNIETAFPLLRGVHGTAAAAPGGVLFAGFGGEISDDPRQPRDERQKLSYPRWEAEYRLKVLGEFDYDELVLLIWTAPAHKGQQRAGSEAVADLIGTHRPRLVVCGSERGVEILGRSTIVAPGSLRDGHYAVADLRERTAVLKELTAAPGRLTRAPRAGHASSLGSVPPACRRVCRGCDLRMPAAARIVHAVLRDVSGDERAGRSQGGASASGP